MAYSDLSDSEMQRLILRKIIFSCSEDSWDFIKLEKDTRKRAEVGGSSDLSAALALVEGESKERDGVRKCLRWEGRSEKFSDRFVLGIP